MGVSISSLVLGNSLRVSNGYNNDVVFRNEGRVDGPSRAVPRKELFEALESVCDVTIIDNNELPKPYAEDEGIIVVDINETRGRYIQKHDTVERLEDDARAFLALAKYLRTHPRVDETQVERLTDLMNNVSPNPWADSSNLARRLIETGKVEVHD